MPEKTNIRERLKEWARTDLAWQALLVLGVGLRLRQYLHNRSLWGDEASLAVNIVERSFGGLIEPLGFHQAAPLGFLFIEKLSILLLWNADYILRLFPLLAGLTSLYFMCRLARENFNTAGMVAVLIFSSNLMLNFYASELKQYSTDVLSALLLVYLALPCFKADARPRDCLPLGIAGAVMIWLSHVTIFILAGIGLTLVFENMLHKSYKNLPWIFGLGLAWLASFGLDYFIALRHTAGDEYFLTYWARRFAPMPPWSHSEWFFSAAYLFMFTIINSTDYYLMRFLSTLSVIGAVSLFVRKRHLALMLILPFFVTLAASALKTYPLAYRFMLFLTPYALLFIAEGIGAIYSLLAKWQRGLALIVSGIPAAYLITLALLNVNYLVKAPQTLSEIRPVVQYVAEHKQADDKVYVYYGAVPGVMYYAPQYDWKLDANLVMLGSYRQVEEKAFKKFFEDMEALKGLERVWFIFNEIANCGGCAGDSREYFRNAIAQYGTLLDSFLDVQSAAYLFDLRK